MKIGLFLFVLLGACGMPDPLVRAKQLEVHTEQIKHFLSWETDFLKTAPPLCKEVYYEGRTKLVSMITEQGKLLVNLLRSEDQTLPQQTL